MFKNLVYYIIMMELALCAYLISCSKKEVKTVKLIGPSDEACADYLARENQAWLEDLAKLEKMKKGAGVK